MFSFNLFYDYRKKKPDLINQTEAEIRWMPVGFVTGVVGTLFVSAAVGRKKEVAENGDPKTSGGLEGTPPTK